LGDNFDVPPSLYRVQRSLLLPARLVRVFEISSQNLIELFAWDSSSADGGSDVNAKYHAWNSSESVSISTPAMVCGIGNEFQSVFWYMPDNNVPFAIQSSSHPSFVIEQI
jgi:hypothetical protein